MTIEVQTRSEENGLSYYDTVEKAILAAEKDDTIWKVSFKAEDGSRVRLVKGSDGMWRYEPLLPLQYIPG